MTNTESTEAFTTAYNTLNEAQKQAVDTIEGPVMVVAGPGTGKTQILTLRIANILLQTQMDPENILALTFTEAGAKAMRERLRRYVGSAAYRVPIHTFHGFAQRLIREYPDAYTRVVGGRPASELEKIHIIESIIDAGEVQLLRPMGAPSYYVQPIRRIIGTLKQEYITPEQLAKIIADQQVALQEVEQFHQKGAHKGKVRGEYTKKEKAIAKNQELLHVYGRYQAALTEQRLFDFDDMIIETVQALETQEDMLRDLQEKYQYVLADEHQDVNGSQNRILELLCSFHDQPNIFAVGDEKQAIYRFQGASLENFLYFKELFPQTTTIHLTDNYRSGQSILDASSSLMETDDERLQAYRSLLTAKGERQAEVLQRDFSHQAIEDDWLVSEVQAKLEAGVPAEEIAVIVRTNREVEGIAEQLRKSGVSVTASAEGDILEHSLTHTVQSLIAAITEVTNDNALFSVLHGAYWGISTSDLVRVCAAQTYKRRLSAILSDRTFLDTLELDDIDAVYNVHTTLVEARKRETVEAPHRVIEYVLTASGFLDYVLTHDPFEGVRVVRRLYDEVEEMVRRDGVATLMEVQQVFTTARSYNLPLNAPYIATTDRAVQVMTAHKSKGLEFAVVFAPHLQDNTWGGTTKRTYFDVPLTKKIGAEDFDAMDDERRLLYVVMTRAKKELHLSCAETNADGKELLPTRLLEDIDDGLYEVVDTSAAESTFGPLLAVRAAQHEVRVEVSVLAYLFTERGFSATSLNNYLKNPWDYLYRNILRIPEVQPTHMQFGTAVHNVLEQTTRTHTEKGTLPSDTQLKNWLEVELERMPISDKEYTRLHEKGLMVLYGYTKHLQSTLPQATKEELSIRVILNTQDAEMPEIPLTGKLDRLDLDEKGFALRVVDYKTGKAMSRNVIEGKTASSDGGYKRQLVFYALLLSLYDDERYRTTTGTLSFVEPDSKGVIKEETFVITVDEIEALKETIINAAKEIVTGSCLTQSYEESEYAHLARMLTQK